MSVLRTLAAASMLVATLAAAEGPAPAARKSPEPAATFDASASGAENRDDSTRAEGEDLLSRIPEPGTLGLIIAGLAVMVFVARRQPRD